MKGREAFAGMLVVLLLIMPVFALSTPSVSGTSSDHVRRFRLLAVEHMFDSIRMKSAQFLIEELLRHPNWNNSTDGYESYIHFLSLYDYVEVDNVTRPFWQGNLSNVKNQVIGFLGQALPGEIVVFYYCGHDYFLDALTNAGLVDWLRSGGLPQAYVVAILDTCAAGHMIYLLPDMTVLAASTSSQLAWGGWWNDGPSGIFTMGLMSGFIVTNDSNNDGWISAAEVFTFAENFTKSLVTWTNQDPQSHYATFEGDLPLVQRDISKPFPTLDIALLSVGANLLRVEPGFPVEINVTVENQGVKRAISEISVYSNSSLIAKQQVTLAPGENATLTFVWNTQGLYGIYTINAVASVLIGEIETRNNIYAMDRTLKVAFRADIDINGEVDIRDIAKDALAFGSYLNHPRWNPDADINQDGEVDITDVAFVAKNFGKTYT